ncbi:MAG: cyclic pyranopterin monophosphate synthase MoaC [Candidatus Nezhaarchaeota archaeon]|nr:cyclic pyranopterin monophosphate synthase MoaC [Candidatus Nezhaarchaeota archaeon]
MMVDVSSKEEVYREAEAEGFIKLKRETLERIAKNEVEKGDVLSVTTTAAIMAAKKTAEILPLCHQLPLTNVSIKIALEDEGVRVRSLVKTVGKTGVEMEALVAVAAALLNIWDMVKRYEKDDAGQYPHTEITCIRVKKKAKVEVNEQNG